MKEKSVSLAAARWLARGQVPSPTFRGSAPTGDNIQGAPVLCHTCVCSSLLPFAYLLCSLGAQKSGSHPHAVLAFTWLSVKSGCPHNVAGCRAWNVGSQNDDEWTVCEVPDACPGRVQSLVSSQGPRFLCNAAPFCPSSPDSCLGRPR